MSGPRKISSRGPSSHFVVKATDALPANCRDDVPLNRSAKGFKMHISVKNLHLTNV